MMEACIPTMWHRGVFVTVKHFIFVCSVEGLNHGYHLSVFVHNNVNLELLTAQFVSSLAWHCNGRQTFLQGVAGSAPSYSKNNAPTQISGGVVVLR